MVTLDAVVPIWLLELSYSFFSNQIGWYQMVCDSIAGSFRSDFHKLCQLGDVLFGMAYLGCRLRCHFSVAPVRQPFADQI